MAKLNKSDVGRVAGLAKLKLTSGEVEKFQGQLAKVLEYVEQLNEVETKGVEPTAQTTGLTNVWQEDKVDESQALSQEEALSGTEKTDNRYFVVEAVIDKERRDSGSGPE
jgi:aspartyl-tRNA(Asn)/glutamyl-tRNA(Gln) amidotransferase subunit C